MKERGSSKDPSPKGHRAAAIAPWLEDLSQLQEPEKFDSSLVNSPIEYYLNQPEERPHLWI